MNMQPESKTAGSIWLNFIATWNYLRSAEHCKKTAFGICIPMPCEQIKDLLWRRKCSVGYITIMLFFHRLMWSSGRLPKPSRLLTDLFFRHLLHNWESSINQHSTACSYQKGNNLPDLRGYFSLPVKLIVKTCCNISLDLIPLPRWNNLMVLSFLFTRTNYSNWRVRAGKWAAEIWQNSPISDVTLRWFVSFRKPEQHWLTRLSSYTNALWAVCSASLKRKQAERLQLTGKLIQSKLRQYVTVGQALLHARKSGEDPWAAIEDVIPWQEFVNSLEETQLLSRKGNFDPLHLITEKYGTLRKYAPQMLSALQFVATPAAQALSDALDTIREIIP